MLPRVAGITPTSFSIRRLYSRGGQNRACSKNTASKALWSPPSMMRLHQLYLFLWPLRGYIFATLCGRMQIPKRLQRPRMSFSLASPGGILCCVAAKNRCRGPTCRRPVLKSKWSRSCPLSLASLVYVCPPQKVWTYRQMSVLLPPWRTFSGSWSVGL